MDHNYSKFDEENKSCVICDFRESAVGASRYVVGLDIISKKQTEVNVYSIVGCAGASVIGKRMIVRGECYSFIESEGGNADIIRPLLAEMLTRDFLCVRVSEEASPW